MAYLGVINYAYKHRNRIQIGLPYIHHKRSIVMLPIYPYTHTHPPLKFSVYYATLNMGKPQPHRKRHYTYTLPFQNVSKTLRDGCELYLH